jgi:predicted lipid-binding transport protein (Tim44 family)
MLRFRNIFALLAARAVMSLLIVDADARVSRGVSSGSRGARTFSAPPPTATAPSTAAPMQRTITTPNATRPSTAPAQSPGLAGRPGGLFGGGLLGGLAAGFIGAGLFGLLFGHGFMGGLGGFASIIGLLLQVGLVIIVARLAWAWWQRRQGQGQPAFASGPSMRDNAMGSGGSAMGSGGGFFGMGGGAATAAAADTGAPIEIEPKDFDAFEHLLEEVQQAYSDEDLNALRPLATPEMLSYFGEDLADNASRGVINKVSDVKLLQGDLAEAWREGDIDYATVAMRFSLTDQTLDRTTGRLVEGSTSSMEATELWTFRRAPRGNWVVAAIQQTN